MWQFGFDLRWVFFCEKRISERLPERYSTLSNIIYIYVYIYISKYVFRAVGCFPGPHLAKRFTEVHIN